jgi:hypothetical protein
VVCEIKAKSPSHPLSPHWRPEVGSSSPKSVVGQFGSLRLFFLLSFPKGGPRRAPGSPANLFAGVGAPGSPANLFAGVGAPGSPGNLLAGVGAPGSPANLLAGVGACWLGCKGIRFCTSKLTHYPEVRLNAFPPDRHNGAEPWAKSNQPDCLPPGPPPPWATVLAPSPGTRDTPPQSSPPSTLKTRSPPACRT